MLADNFSIEQYTSQGIHLNIFIRIDDNETYHDVIKNSLDILAYYPGQVGRKLLDGFHCTEANSYRRLPQWHQS